MVKFINICGKLVDKNELLEIGVSQKINFCSVRYDDDCDKWGLYYKYKNGDKFWTMFETKEYAEKAFKKIEKELVGK